MTNYKKLRVNIRLSALSGLANRIVEYYRTKDLSVYPDYEQIVNILKELARQFSAALNQEKSLSELTELDSVRDEKYRALFQMLQGYTNAPAAAISAPASKVFGILQRYGLSVVSLAYDEESGMIDSLLGDLAAEDVAAEISKLTFIPEMVEALRQSESDFKQASNLYEQSKTLEKEKSPSASKLKAPLLKVINEHIVSYHVALATFKDEAFRGIANTINGMIETENALTRSRADKKESE